MAKTTNLKHLMFFIALICCIQEGTGATTSLSTSTAQVNSTANIDFIIHLDAGETIIGTSTWFFGTNKIADSDETTLTPIQSYSSRLTAYGKYGISLHQVQDTDAGTYTYTVTISPGANPFTATATLSVPVAAGEIIRSSSTNIHGIGGHILGFPCYIIIALLAMLANA